MFLSTTLKFKVGGKTLNSNNPNTNIKSLSIQPQQLGKWYALIHSTCAMIGSPLTWYHYQKMVTFEQSWGRQLYDNTKSTNFNQKVTPNFFEFSCFHSIAPIQDPNY